MGAGPAPAHGPNSAAPKVLTQLDMSPTISSEHYGIELKALRTRLHSLYRHARSEALPTVLVFEGQDAAGKGGAIRRMTTALDARDYRVIPISAPTDEERAHHFLWRFWRHLARVGRFTIFNRSWYGRVLVEYVEILYRTTFTNAPLTRSTGSKSSSRSPLVEILAAYRQG